MILGKIARFVVTVALIFSAAIFGQLPASAEEKPFRYGLEKNNPVFLTRKASIQGSSFRLAIKDGTPAKIIVELVDIYSDSSGSKKALPVGSTPFSAEGLVKFKRSLPDYNPSTEFQYFDISFRFKKKYKVTSPVLGGLKISLLTQEPASDKVKIESSVVGTFAYFPKGSGVNFGPSISLSDSKVVRMGSDFPPFGLIPDFPVLFNGGSLVLGYQFENTGDIFLEATSKVVVRGPLFFGWGSEQEPFSYNSGKSFVVPNQVISQQVPIELELKDGRTKDPLGIGVYEVLTTVTGNLGDELEATDSSSKIIVIFPWKYLLFVLLLATLFRKKIGSSVSRIIRFFRNLREFTKQRNQPPRIDTDSPTIASVDNVITELPISKLPNPERPPSLQPKIYKPSPNPFPSKRPESISRVPSDLQTLFPASSELSRIKFKDVEQTNNLATEKSSESSRSESGPNPDSTESSDSAGE